MVINDGGPAFPRPASEYTRNGSCPDGNDPICEQDGLSARDYFAAAALSGVLMARATTGAEMLQESIAEECYELADAMLAARARAPQEA